MQIFISHYEINGPLSKHEIVLADNRGCDISNFRMRLIWTIINNGLEVSVTTGKMQRAGLSLNWVRISRATPLKND